MEMYQKPSLYGDIADLKDAKSNPKMTPAEWSRLIMWMLLEDLLEEAFIATAYAFNTYLIVSSQGASSCPIAARRSTCPLL